MVDLLRGLSVATVEIVRAEARWLESALRARLHQEHGYAAFGDWTRERLRMEPRTARRRVALDRALERSPGLEAPLKTGQLGICQVLLLGQVVDSDSVDPWVRLAEQSSVRELQKLVRDAKAAEALDAGGAGRAGSPEGAGNAGNTEGAGSAEGFGGVQSGEGEALRPINISAPVSTGILFDETIEIARRRLGWQAPRHVAFEHLLVEAEQQLLGESGQYDPTDFFEKPRDGDSLEDADPLDDADPRGATSTRGSTGGDDHGAPSEGVVPVTCASPPEAGASTLDRATATIRAVQRELKILATRCTLHPPRTGSTLTRADRTVDHLRHLDSLRRPLRVLRAGVLRELRDLDAPALLGFRSLAALVEAELGMSERTARNLIAEMDCLDEDPQLAWAFESGRVGMAQALLLSRVASPRTRSAWIARAETVTHAQLEREVRVLRRIPYVAPGLFVDMPFPVDIEAMLRTRLGWRGWTEPDLDARLAGLTGPDPATLAASTPATGQGLPSTVPTQSFGSQDPAEDPRVLARLDILLDILDLELVPSQLNPEQVPGGLNPELASGNLIPELVPGKGDQDIATEEPHRQMLSTAPRARSIVLRLPEHVYRHWIEVLDRLRSVRGPLPPWAALTLLCEAACQEWLQWDPASKPAKFAILERDGWRCQAPGCGARRNLEVHHIQFRSRNGSLTAENEITLCHGHHRRGIHEGRARLEGSAPGQLHWSLGRHGSRHREHYRGHRRTG